MITALVLRDPAVRSLPKWLLVGVLTASVIAGVRTLLATIHEVDAGYAPSFADHLLLAFALWLPVALFLAFGNAGQRCQRLDLTLPVSANRLNAAHLVGVLLAGSIVTAAAAGIVLFHDRILVGLRGAAPQPAVGELILYVVAALILSATGLLSLQPSVYRARSGGKQFLFVTTYLLGGLGLILVLQALPLAVSLLPLAVAAVLVLRSFRALPAALTLVPFSTDEEDDHGGEASWSAIERAAPASEITPARRGLRTARLDLTIYRVFVMGIAPTQLLRIPVNVISIPFLFGMGLVLSGFVFDNPIRLTNVTLTAYMVLAFLAAPMAQLHLLDPLPVSRRRIFAVVLLPLLLSVAAGYAAGRVGVAVAAERPAILFTSAPTRNHAPVYRSDTPTLRVPATEFLVAWDGDVPANVSPWGETHEAWRIPLYKGASAMVYSPFSTNDASSIDFVAWQISRAVEAVYGETIPYEEIRERYLETASDGTVALRDPAGLTLLQDYPELTAGGEGPVFPVVMLLTGLLSLLLGALYFRAFNASVSERARKGVFFALLGGALVLHIAQFVAFITGFVEDWVVLGQLEAGIRWSSVKAPGGGFTVWILCALIFAGGYRLARGVFERIEVPLPRPGPAA